jgi:hypothetical protein
MLELLILAFFIQCAIAAFLAHLFHFPDRVFSDVIPYLRPHHTAELEDLLDPIKEENLLLALGHRRFRKEQLKRLHLAHECIAQRAHNARVFQEWGDTEHECATKNLNSEARERAKTLVDVCLHYRANAVVIQGTLYMWYLRMAILPFLRLPRVSNLRRPRSFDLMNSYTNVVGAAQDLALACGGACREMLTRTLQSAQEKATDEAWMPEMKILGPGMIHAAGPSISP